MWDFLALLLIVSLVGAFFLTFVIKDENHAFYRGLGNIAKVVFGGMLVIIVLAFCTGQFSSTDDPVIERQYPR